MSRHASSSAPGSRWARRPGWWVLLGGVVAAGILAAVLVPLMLSPGGPKPAPVTAGRAGMAAPPVRVCGNPSIIGAGPRSAPHGAIIVRAGDDSGVNWGRPGATYWFASGRHTLGAGQYTQIIPGRQATFIGAPGATLDGQHANLYAFGGHAAGVTISYLTIQDFGPEGANQNQGVVNEDSASGWTVDHATLRDNAGAGVMLGSHNTLVYDCLEDNQQYGFNAYSPTGPVDLVIEHNEIAGNDTYNWERRDPGCGCTGGGKFWDVSGAVITGNWVHGNHSVGLWADTNNRSFDIQGNTFTENYDSALIYEISYNALIKGNTFIRNGLGVGPRNPGFPTGAIYLSESGADSRVSGKYGKVLDVTENTFVNNWGGVILWENSNRFCNSPANTSSGVCTLVDPSGVTLASCRAGEITKEPFYSDCRWKTQNVLVSHNTFEFSPASIGPSCTVAKECGFQGIFSEYGSYPSWSPYQGTTVEKNITFHQDNRFSVNVYRGPWRFMILQQGDVVSWAKWRGKPYRQDGGSTMDSSTAAP